MTQSAFCQLAGVDLSTYTRLLAGLTVARPGIVKRLMAVAAGNPLPQLHPLVIRSVHRSAMVLIAAEMGVDPRLVLSADFEKQRPRDPVWLEAARIRRVAMYVLVVEAGIASAAAVGRAIGCTKQNVGQALGYVEAEREKIPALNALIAKIPL